MYISRARLKLIKEFHDAADVLQQKSIAATKEAVAMGAEFNPTLTDMSDEEYQTVVDRTHPAMVQQDHCWALSQDAMVDFDRLMEKYEADKKQVPW